MDHHHESDQPATKTKLSHEIDKKNYFIIEDENNAFAKRILQSGKDDEHPNIGSKVKVLIHFFDDFEIKESEIGDYKIGREYTDVVVGEGDTELSELIDDVIQTMKKQEWCYIKTKLQFPRKSSATADKKGVPSSDQVFIGLTFSIRLQSFSCSPDLNELDITKRIEFAERHKLKGVEHFKADEIYCSRRRFEKALFYLKTINRSLISDSDGLGKSVSTLTSHCYMNLAAGFLKEEHYEKVVELCSVGLEFDPDNIKGLFRRSQAYRKLNRLSEARIDLMHARQKDSSNKAVLSSLQEVENLMKKESKIYKKMFSA